jgi:hypothetical protein
MARNLMGKPIPKRHERNHPRLANAPIAAIPSGLPLLFAYVLALQAVIFPPDYITHVQEGGFYGWPEGAALVCMRATLL